MSAFTFDRIKEALLDLERLSYNHPSEFKIWEAGMEKIEIAIRDMTDNVIEQAQKQ